ncbi:MAG: toll/interleukin-1 receptor domain-containing protein [Dehalococcoidia bacterium]
MAELPDDDAPYVFLSYASGDRPRALELADRLEARDVRVWIDRTSIAGGSSWTAEIVRGVHHCAALLVLCLHKQRGRFELARTNWLPYTDGRTILQEPTHALRQARQ